MHANAQYSTETLIIHRFSSMPPKPTEHLWNPLIPRGKITLLAADPGSGKTTLALTLAAHLSRGAQLPHLTPGDSPGACATYMPERAAHPEKPLDQNESPAIRSLGSPQMNNEQSSMNNPHPQSTLLLSPEDDPNDTLHPRLLAANANLEHIHFLENLHSLIPQKPRATDHGPRATPLEKLRQVCNDIPNLALLVIDPITHYLGLSDRLAPPSPDDPDAPRSILHQLAQLARERHIAILLTTRLTKRIDPTLSPHSHQKILGPLSFPATARSVLLLSPLPPSPPPSTHLTPGDSLGTCATCPPEKTAHPEKPLDQNESPAIRSLGSPPMNNEQSTMNNPSPTHLLIPLKLSTSAIPAPIPYTLTNKITFHPDTPLPTPPEKKLGRPDLLAQSAADWLLSTLANGPVSATQILHDAKSNIISHATLERAKQLLGIQTIKQNWSNRWFWQLPHETRPLPENKAERELFELLNTMAQNLQSRPSPTPPINEDTDEDDQIEELEDPDDLEEDEEDDQDDQEDDGEDDDDYDDEEHEEEEEGEDDEEGGATSEDLAGFPHIPPEHSEDLPESRTSSHNIPRISRAKPHPENPQPQRAGHPTPPPPPGTPPRTRPHNPSPI